MLENRFRFRYLALGLFGIGLISFLGTYVYMVATARSQTSVNLIPALTAPGTKNMLPSDELELAAPVEFSGTARVITKNATEIVREYRYTKCGHVEVGIPVVDPGLQGMSMDQLKQRYKGEEGWEVIEAESNRIILRLSLDGFCPQDAVKRHLGVVDGKVAIFYGPAGYPGGLEKLTNLPVSALPEKWQQQIVLGWLEFADVESLVQALDNLDEYR